VLRSKRFALANVEHDERRVALFDARRDWYAGPAPRSAGSSRSVRPAAARAHASP
jgi:hypothetical protein